MLQHAFKLPGPLGSPPPIILYSWGHHKELECKIRERGIWKTDRKAEHTIAYWTGNSIWSFSKFSFLIRIRIWVLTGFRHHLVCSYCYVEKQGTEGLTLNCRVSWGKNPSPCIAYFNHLSFTSVNPMPNTKSSKLQLPLNVY